MKLKKLFYNPNTRLLLSILSIILAAVLSLSAKAGDKKFTFDFHKKPMSQVLKAYSKNTGQNFVFDPNQDYPISIMASDKVSKDKAFELLSQALASKGLALSEQNGTMVVKKARNIQRSFIPVVTHLPPVAPEKMVTWVIDLKHVKASDILKNLRILPSKDGEMSPMGEGQLVITDWVTNLHRVKKILAKVDRAQADK